MYGWNNQQKDTFKTQLQLLKFFTNALAMIKSFKIKGLKADPN